MSGYDIRQLIPRSIGYFWTESYGQIYPSLKKLAAAGLIEKKTERQSGRPDRHLYSLTKAGSEQLKQWLQLPVPEPVPRNELLLKVFLGAHVPLRVSREHVTAHLETHRKALKEYASVAKSLRKGGANDPQLPFWLMTLSMGQHASNAAVKWCKETLSKLDEMERSEGGGK